MTKSRVEAFSDGVLAIVITIMVLEMKTPHGTDIAALRGLLPVLSSYALSFVFIGIYWNNHHHLLQAVRHVNGRVLWANLHLLFWLSLIPFTNRWMGETHFASLPVASYGVILLLAAVAYFVLVHTLLRCDQGNDVLRAAIGNDFKGKVSILFYVAAVPLAFVRPAFAWLFYIAVALIWLVPDRRIEDRLKG
jgi:TMEM175 potassium channel family protein